MKKEKDSGNEHLGQVIHIHMDALEKLRISVARLPDGRAVFAHPDRPIEIMDAQAAKELFGS